MEIPPFFNYFKNMARKKFLLCFHDYSVWNFEKMTPILYELKDLAGRAFSILVIPDTEGADPTVIENFRKALDKLKEDGFELALHGFKHKAEFSQGRNYMGMIGMTLTHGEAEFAGLSEYESDRLLQAGFDAWEKLLPGTKPAAFIPPTWYSNGTLPIQVRRRKMLYEDRYSLTTEHGIRYPSPVASFAGIPKCLEKLAISFARLILQFPFGTPRLALHPVDFPEMRNVIQDLIRLALSNGRKLTHYGDL